MESVFSLFNRKTPKFVCQWTSLICLSIDILNLFVNGHCKLPLITDQSYYHLQFASQILEQNNFCLVAFWVRPWECTAAFRRPLRPSFMLLSKLVYNLCVCACGLSRFLCRGIIKTRWYIWVQQCGTLEIALDSLLRFFNEFLH